MQPLDLSQFVSPSEEDLTPSTGRYLVVLQEDYLPEGIAFLRSEGFEVFVSEASDPEVPREDEVGDATAIILSVLGVAVVEAKPEEIARLQDAVDNLGPILTIEPERVRHILPFSPRARERMAELELLTREGLLNITAAVPADVTFATWGLQATNVVDTKYTGDGIRVAILDTGIALEVEQGGSVRYHPDFDGRRIVSRSFVRGVVLAKDGNGHGTHCVGTACGSSQPTPRYGIACEAEIYVGKVADDAGIGADVWTVAGLEWAVKNGCQIASMSLGGRAKKAGQGFNQAYEEIARRALKKGTLIIAAAGNDSGRPTNVLPVVGPADCPSVIAVSAIDQSLENLWPLSNGGINPNGGEINFAAPGVGIYSSYVLPQHKVKSGTSMATPYVAGIAALHAQARPGFVGQALWDLLKKSVRQVPLPASDVGNGLIQAP